MRKSRQVMLMIETSTAFARGLIDGIGRYAMTHGNWLLCAKERGLDDDALRLLRSWKGDGIIFRGANQATVEAIRRKRVPAVNAFPNVYADDFPLVHPDEDRIVKLAVSHFMERRFRNFAFCAVENLRWVEWRRQAYLRELARHGIKPHVLILGKSAEERWNQQHKQLVGWATSLPKPVAILAANDFSATRLNAACRTAGVRVPDDAAVLGVDNDDVLCHLTSPPLSSIDLNSSAIGRQAAMLLDDLMEGGATPAEPVWVPARGVVTRRSTEALAIDDDDVIRAVRFIREHVCNGIDVPHVVSNVNVSRTTLERKFAALLQMTPGQAISQARIQRVKEFLSETDYAIERIAQLVGYCTQSHLTVAFKRETGMTPGEFRRQAQGR